MKKRHAATTCNLYDPYEDDLFDEVLYEEMRRFRIIRALKRVAIYAAIIGVLCLYATMHY